MMIGEYGNYTAIEFRVISLRVQQGGTLVVIGGKGDIMIMADCRWFMVVPVMEDDKGGKRGLGDHINLRHISAI